MSRRRRSTLTLEVLQLENRISPAAFPIGPAPQSADPQHGDVTGRITALAVGVDRFNNPELFLGAQTGGVWGSAISMQPTQRGLR
jgi:hypothetical protein